MTQHSQSYPAVVTRIIDGDSLVITAEVWPEPRLYCDVEVRLLQAQAPYGINAREHNMPGGPEATAHLAQLIGPLPAACRVDVKGADKFGGRIDAVVYTGAGVDVAAQMVADGYAAAWDGNGPRPLAPWPLPQPLPAGGPDVQS